MPEQTQSLPVAAGQSWNTKALIPAAGIGYLLLNRKTRKPALIGAGALLVYTGIRWKNEGFGMTEGIGKLALGAGGLLLFLGLRSKR
jgi:hypothetical protein